MIKLVYKQLKQEFKNKVNGSDNLFIQFCYTYIVELSNDSDILEIVNSKNRDMNSISIEDYLSNDNILIRAIKILTLLEISKDFKGFLKLYKALKTDKDNSTIEFDKILLELIK
ncbi:MAG: hypothetical protein ACLGH8_01275 [Bacteroidia bacterium]